MQPTRTRIRHKYGLEEAPYSDCMSTTLLCCFAICQEASEIEVRRPGPHALHAVPARREMLPREAWIYTCAHHKGPLGWSALPPCSACLLGPALHRLATLERGLGRHQRAAGTVTADADSKLAADLHMCCAACSTR